LFRNYFLIVDVVVVVVTTEITTGRRTKKIKFVKTEFGVATIVIIGNYGKS